MTLELECILEFEQEQHTAKLGVEHITQRVAHIIQHTAKRVAHTTKPGLELEHTLLGRRFKYMNFPQHLVPIQMDILNIRFIRYLEPSLKDSWEMYSLEHMASHSISILMQIHQSQVTKLRHFCWSFGI